jgi:hypothetical protein
MMVRGVVNGRVAGTEVRPMVGGAIQDRRRVAVTERAWLAVGEGRGRGHHLLITVLENQKSKLNKHDTSSSSLEWLFFSYKRYPLSERNNHLQHSRRSPLYWRT